MILMRANQLQGPLEARLFWALKWQRAKRVPFGSKKQDFEEQLTKNIIKNNQIKIMFKK